MKISLNWLKEFIDLDEDVEQIAEVLTDTGLEVEGLESFEEIKGGLSGVVIGEVLQCAKHPNADILSITMVDIGTEKLSPIVCGAPNVAVGQKVAVATIGTTLHPISGDVFKIKKAKIRGEVSEGMICAENEIGLGAEHDGIMVLDTDLPNGTPARDYFQPSSDTIIEIGLTPNRADAASHMGVARDLKAFYQRPVHLPDVSGFKVDNTSNPIEVVVENTEACPRYSGLTLSNIEVKKSPKWLITKLKGIGLVPVNNVVDVTNYVLHSLGQPMHAFDADKILGKTVVVKTLAKDSKFITLDQVERTLSEKDLMICNEASAMCIAGVFGGINSGVKESTKNIFLESAYFSAKYVRNTATLHSLKTDASFRYERGTDPNMTVLALKWAAILIKELAGGEISSEVVDIYPKPVAPFEIDVTYKNIDRLIGKQLEPKLIKEILQNLDIEVKEATQDGFHCTVPPFRVDVTREADIIEEILRIYGFNNIEMEENYGADYLASFPTTDQDKIQEKTTQFLAARGYNEIITNSLTNPAYVSNTQICPTEQKVEILNKLSKELGVLRQSMVFTGLESLQYNINRKQTNLKFFEFGRTYFKSENEYTENEHLAIFLTGNKKEESWNVDKKPIDFYDISSTVHNLLDKFSFSDLDAVPSANPVFEYGVDISSHGASIVTMGKLNQKILKAGGVSQDVFYADFDWERLLKSYGEKVLYQQVSKFPEVKRDLSLVIDKGVTFDRIKALALIEGKRLIKRINVFSVYEGDSIGKDKKSYALSFILQDNEKTLKDKQIDQVMNALIGSFENNLNAIIRK